MEAKEQLVYIWHYRTDQEEPKELLLTGSDYAELITPDPTSTLTYKNQVRTVTDSLTGTRIHVVVKDVYFSVECAYRAYHDHLLKVRSRQEAEIANLGIQHHQTRTALTRAKEVLRSLAQEKKLANKKGSK